MNENNSPENKPVSEKISSELKEKFFKAVLSDQPFTHSQSLFNDALTIEFRSPTVQEMNSVYAELKKDEVNDILTTDAAYVMKLTNYRLALGIVKINNLPFLPEFTEESYKPTDTSDSYLKARLRVIEGWPIFKLSIIAEAYKEFENLVIDLTKEINTPGFWKAAE